MSAPYENPSNDIKAGKEAMVFFHNEALKYPENYSMRITELYDLLNHKSPAFLDGFGFAINSSSVSPAKVKTAMESIANQGHGKIPSHLNDFFNALSHEAVKVSFWDAAESTAIDTAKDVGTGLVAVGNTTISTLKTSAMLLPFALVIAIILFGYEKGKA